MTGRHCIGRLGKVTHTYISTLAKLSVSIRPRRKVVSAALLNSIHSIAAAWYCVVGHLTVADILVQKGAQINAQDKCAPHMCLLCFGFLKCAVCA